ncbi:MAG: hypothetical protein JRN68_03795 [Nitrososphaerota archaeon]|jgi:hypothetical protein|nr:hypothetical protein [Nitrososphaerota archaeon]
MKASIVWSSPEPEKTIAIAMRRCYSTKPIEEIQSELDQKGSEYWKHLIGLALRDKSLDVVEHFCLEVLIEGLPENEAGRLAMYFPFMRFLKISQDVWLVSINARTLIEAYHTPEGKGVMSEIMAAMKKSDVGSDFLQVAFGEVAN